MNILMITHENKLNGASKSMLNLIDQMKDEHSFVVLCPFNNGPIYEELAIRNIPVLYVPFKFWMRINNGNVFRWIKIQAKWCLYNQFKNRMLAFRTVKVMKKYNINLIHTNTSVVNFGGLLHGLTGIPHLWYIREFGQEDFNMYPVISENSFFDFIDKYSNCVVTISKALETKYKEKLNYTDLQMIYNGVGLENVIEDRKFDDNKELVSFLITGTIHPGKGHAIAFNAAKDLVESGITNFKIYVAGEGDTSKLKDIFSEQDKYIEFLGLVHDMPSLRKKMDVEMVCSKSEAFGRVTIEAMLGAMPVIGSNSGGTPELIQDGYTGFLFKQGDSKDLAKCMKRLICYRKDIKKMGILAQEYAIHNFTIARCADQVNNLYKKMGGGV